MTGRSRNKRGTDTAERLAAAERAGEAIADRTADVDRQISLVGRLTEGWRKVHEQNHLAQLFQEDWGRIR